MAKRVKTISENSTGRNERFKDNYTGQEMSRTQFVRNIENNVNNYQNKYHVRNINGLKTPCSNPDGKTNNNLD